MKFLLFLFMLSHFSFAAKFQKKDFPWMEDLSRQGVSEIYICGDANIMNNTKSLKKNFYIGHPSRAFVFSGLPTHSRYWEILKTKNKQEAHQELKQAFSDSILWEISAEEKAISLGENAQFITEFTATVKDCVEGARTTLGNNCSGLKPEQRVGCCSEKFLGPKISWKKENQEYTLFYSPDPSVSLRVSGEKSHRFCHVVESARF